MKIPTLCSLVLAGMFLLPCSAISASYGDIYVSLIDGDVLMNTEDTQDWVPVAGNTPLGESDRIWVADGSRSELRLRHGTVIRLNSRTAFEVAVIEENGIRFFVDAGEVYVHVEEPGGEVIAIETPAATIHPDQRSSFRIDVNETGEVSLSVVNGVVMVDRPHGDLQVASGQRLVFRPDWSRPQLAALRSADAFDRWNRGRDHEQFDMGPGVSRQYLPEELSSYAADFDHNGRWVETPDYGFVWTPSAVVARGWSPYHSGRWVWMRGDYVWISYDNWGWAPHHYGRWAFVRPFGWCWVPPARKQTYWGPGYVGWVHTAAAISWVPLAPREVYYGHGFHGPQSVDVGRLPRQAPTNQNVNLYRNVRVANAVMTVHRDTFLTGKPSTFKAQPNPFLQQRTVFAPPSIKPEKATTMPLIREVRSSERPPAHIFMDKAKRNEKTRPISSPPPSPGHDKAPPKVAPTVMPDRPADRELRVPKNENKSPRTTVPVSSAPPQSGMTAPKAAKPSVKGEQRPKEEVKTGAQPAGADDRIKTPVRDVSKRPLPLSATQTSEGPKNPLSSSVTRVDGRISKGKLEDVKETSPRNPPPRIIQKQAETLPKTPLPPPKPSTGAVTPVTQKKPAAPHKPPAPDTSRKDDGEKEKHGKEVTEGKDRGQGIQKGGAPVKDGRLGKEPRQEGEIR